MAIDAVSPPEIPVPAMSPRISFSHDFCQTEAIPVEQRPNARSNSSGFNSSFDFDFCIRECSDQESSSADEIFSHGKILPFEIKKKSEEEPPVRVDHSSSTHSPLPLTRTKSLDVNAEKCLKKLDPLAKEIKAASSDSEEKQSSNSNSKSFWRFKRSSSCGSGYTRSLCPLPLLSRSNSTGSAPNIKRTPLSKDGAAQKQSSHRNASKNNSLQCSSSSMGYQKPPLKKVHGSYGNGVQVNPILNVHSGNLFGLGSIFTSGKDRSKKK